MSCKSETGFVWYQIPVPIRTLRKWESQPDHAWQPPLASMIRHRKDFKICLLVYRCLHQLAAPYFVSMISPVSAVSTRRHLRSAGQGDLVVPRTRTTGFGPRSFSVAVPLAWNSLPLEMKTTSLTLGQFSSRLKTEMFYAVTTRQRSRRNFYYKIA